MNTDAGAVDAALRGLRDTLAADGYGLEWSIVEENRLAVRVVAGPEACADCLVPPALLRGILSDALDGTPYRVGSLTLPDSPTLPDSITLPDS